MKPPVTTSELEEDGNQKKRGSFTFSIPVKSRKFSEAVDIEAVMAPLKATGAGSGANVSGDSNSGREKASDYEIIRAKSTSVSLKTISMTYAWSQVATAIVGGFAVTPSGKICIS